MPNIKELKQHTVRIEKRLLYCPPEIQDKLSLMHAYLDAIKKSLPDVRVMDKEFWEGRK